MEITPVNISSCKKAFHFITKESGNENNSFFYSRLADRNL